MVSAPSNLHPFPNHHLRNRRSQSQKGCQRSPGQVPNFKYKETEAQRRPVPCPDSPSKVVAMTGPKRSLCPAPLPPLGWHSLRAWPKTSVPMKQGSQTPLGPRAPLPRLSCPPTINLKTRTARPSVLWANGWLPAVGGGLGQDQRQMGAGRKYGGICSARDEQGSGAWPAEFKPQVCHSLAQ